MASSKVDLVIILGGGTDGTLRPIFYTKERLAAFLKSRKKFKGVPIVVSGGYSMWFKRKPRYTEADVMKNLLIKHNVSPKLVHLESKSRDTIGNAYYSKQIIKKLPDVKNILVVTTAGHVKRSRWSFRRIFGRRYKLYFLEAPTKIFSFRNNTGRRRYENYLLGIYRNGLRGIRNGEDREIMKALRKFHPVYSNSLRSKKIKGAIINAKQKYLGYTSLQAIIHSGGK